MNRSSSEWLAPLTGVAFVVLVIVSIVIGGEPPGADEHRKRQPRGGAHGVTGRVARHDVTEAHHGR